MCYSSGGAAFLIPYFFCFFFIAVPLFCIETAYGQLIDMKLHVRWGVIVPRLWGVSICQLFVCFFTCIYYITLMAWSFSFFFASFKSPLPWMIPNAGAQVANSTVNNTVDNLWSDHYFMNETLHASENIQEQGGIVWGLFWCLILAYIVTYFSAWKGLQSTGKMVWITCLAPYVILLVLLIKGLTLDGCGSGIKYLFIPDWSKVADLSIWKASAIQILFSSGVAYGPFLYYGSARKKSDTIVSASFWIPLANSATSIYAAVTVFAFLGHVSTVQKIEISDVTKSGPTLLFVAFPSLLGLLGGANFWAVIFFALCVCLGIDSVFGFFDYYIKITEDAFPEIKKRFPREILVLFVSVFSWIWSLMFIVEGGLYNFDLFDANAGHIQLLFCLLAQTFFLPWVVGLHKLSTLIELHTGETIPTFFVLIIRIFVPIFATFIFIVAFVNEWDTESREAKQWTSGHIWGARMIWIIPMVAVAITAFFPLKDQPDFD